MKKRFPEGWDENKVKTVLLHYEKQTEDEAAKEDELIVKYQSIKRSDTSTDNI
jgi:hypothetical protein